MQRVLQEVPGTAAGAFIVWLPMLTGDDKAAAHRVIATCPDPRAIHFYDPDRLAGRALAAALGGEGKVAWDVYLIYGPGTRWEERPPIPADWAHQLGGSRWADPVRYRTGDDLVLTLRAAVDAAVLTFRVGSGPAAGA